MTSDDQYFLDLLASVPNDIVNYGNRIADYIETHSNSLATDLRGAIEAASWIPESMRPTVRSVPHRFTAPPPPKSLLTKTTAWLSKNRTAVAVVLAFAGTTAILIHRRRRAHAKKRRARRDRNGKKKELVVLAGPSLHDPLARSLALDLDRRGYIVYVTVSSTEEDSLVQSEGKWDIRPLWMDLTSSVPNPGLDIHPNLEPIRQLINPSSHPSSPSSDGSSPSTTFHHTLAGLVILPGSIGYPTGPLATLPPADIIDTINTRLLSPILTVQQFLPLLTLAENPTQTTTKLPTTSSSLPPSPSIIIAYPSISTSLSPPHQLPETVITTSLSNLTRSLRRELAPESRITITELKLGLFDLTPFTFPSPKAGEYVYPHHHHHHHHQSRNPRSTSKNSALTHWHSSQRPTPHQHQQQQQQHPPQHPDLSTPSSSSSSSSSGSSLREFHNAVFDALIPTNTNGPSPTTLPAFGLSFLPGFGTIGTSRRRRSRRGGGGGTRFVGQGARLYDLVGKWVPDGLVGWLIRRRGGEGNWNGGERGGGGEGEGEGRGDTGLGQGEEKEEEEEEEESGEMARGGRVGGEDRDGDGDRGVEASGVVAGDGDGDGESGGGSGSAVWEKV